MVINTQHYKLRFFMNYQSAALPLCYLTTINCCEIRYLNCSLPNSIPCVLDKLAESTEQPRFLPWEFDTIPHHIYEQYLSDLHQKSAQQNLQPGLGMVRPAKYLKVSAHLLYILASIWVVVCYTTKLNVKN